jgi:hypothetical protein
MSMAVGLDPAEGLELAGFDRSLADELASAPDSDLDRIERIVDSSRYLSAEEKAAFRTATAIVREQRQRQQRSA